MSTTSGIAVHRHRNTRAWIWWVDHDPRRGRRFLDALDAMPAEARPAISDITLWEVATLVERGRLSFPVPFAEWLQAAAHPRTVQVLPMTPVIAEEIASLPSSFRRDPADRVIVATSRVYKMPPLIQDPMILASRLASRWLPLR